MTYTSPPYFAKSDETICNVYSFFGKEKRFYSIDFNTALILGDSLVPQHLGSVREYMKKLVYNRWSSNSLWSKQSVINSYFKCSQYFILMVGFNYQRHKGDYCTFFPPDGIMKSRSINTGEQSSYCIYKRNCFFPAAWRCSVFLPFEQQLGLWTCKNTSWLIWGDCFWSSRNKENFSWQCIWTPCSSINWIFHDGTMWFFRLDTGLRSSQEECDLWGEHFPHIFPIVLTSNVEVFPFWMHLEGMEGGRGDPKCWIPCRIMSKCSHVSYHREIFWGFFPLFLSLLL